MYPLHSQVAHVVLMAALAAFAFADSDPWQYEFLAANLVALMLLSVFNAVFQGSVTANLGPFPEQYMGSFMSGQGQDWNEKVLTRNLTYKTAPDFA